ncbi:ABC transporter substrate-binding protein [Psychromarinibacter sp. S121]|uniref:ABC transporter substrate-binding protein n=1 Tax=Psychromarinibacter sp. S121 TaxID=3415127 RepID=UPI003C7C3F58
MNITRRSLLMGAATVPFLNLRAALAQEQDRKIIFGLSTYPANIHPWLHAGTAAATVKFTIHRSLLGYDDEGQIKGELAESWEYEGEGAWLFNLRQNAVWHDGSPVTAEDIKWNIETAAAPDSTAVLAAQLRDITTIEVVGDKTIRLTTAEPIRTLPLTFASTYFHMVKMDSITEDQPGIGAGPYVIAADERGVSIEVEPFADYYDDSIPLNPGVRFVAYGDENLRVSALEAGDVDLIEFVPWSAMDRLAENDEVKMDHVDTGQFMYLVFNSDVEPFNDPKVRLAVAHAIRRQEIVDAVFFGQGAPLEGLPIPPSSPIYDESQDHVYNYDPELAKQLLAEAGYPDGFKTTILSTAQYFMHRDTALVVQQHLAEIGIEAEAVLPDWPTRVGMGDKGEYAIAVGGLAFSSNDPDGLSDGYSSKLAPSNLRSFNMVVPGLDEALEAGRREFDEEKQAAIYDEFKTLAIENAPIVPLTWRRQSYGMRSNVEGFVNLPGSLTNYSGITLATTVLEDE